MCRDTSAHSEDTAQVEITHLVSHQCAVLLLLIMGVMVSNDSLSVVTE